MKIFERDNYFIAEPETSDEDDVLVAASTSGQSVSIAPSPAVPAGQQNSTESAWR